MIEVRETEIFRRWMAELRDAVAKARIAARIRQLAFGLLGDIRPVGEGVSELRVHVGPGYRVYVVQRGEVLIVVLCAGDKNFQARDITRAKALARELDENGGDA
ncbi:type II toxin-antitoxin system RelE/ParE family toxin [Caulobacter hibisci]|uniref:Type II toxin-antitoxin system RelE/ParE family toxin n=1 Tax=Caulobacter hibisci TaxID=2035993 RepID=A0ABS0T585_9CAUL|nr:type II toxin-antitoxin system RelE/ParE family toxin [Caulobacter hibisci]